MLLQLEKRNSASRALIFATPFIAIAITVLLSSTMLLIQGKSLQTTFYAFFIDLNSIRCKSQYNHTRYLDSYLLCFVSRL